MTEKKPEKELKQVEDSEDDRTESEQIIPDEILEAIPEEDRGKVAGIIRQTMISGVMRRSNPIADKITSDHITQLISKSDEQDIRDRTERKGERNYNLILIIIALVFVGFLIIFLRSNEDLLIKIVIGIISFVGGFGFGQSRKNKSE
jgi:hypothetical protein